MSFDVVQYPNRGAALPFVRVGLRVKFPVTWLMSRCRIRTSPNLTTNCAYIRVHHVICHVLACRLMCSSTLTEELHFHLFDSHPDIKRVKSHQQSLLPANIRPARTTRPVQPANAMSKVYLKLNDVSKYQRTELQLHLPFINCCIYPIRPTPTAPLTLACAIS